jgi:DMSO reductase family type II enzyme heme b subunit
MATRLFASLVLLSALFVAACGKTPPGSVGQVTVVKAEALPGDPMDRSWNAAPIHRAKLALQDLVEPRLIEASTTEVLVQAIANGAEIAVRLEWLDPSLDDLPGAARFVDACAIQFPEVASANVPAPQMGEAGRPVRITFWRASWQATVDGRPDAITALYPRAIDQPYPAAGDPTMPESETAVQFAARYAPARARGNTMAGPRTRPVEDLVAAGPGTITPDTAGRSGGRGVRTEKGWAVVLTRPLPDGLTVVPNASRGDGTQIAFAVWQGAANEAGSRKMKTGWIPIFYGER